MDKKLNYLESEDIKILLCKNCYENGEYIIPLININEENKSIEYKCYKCHNIKETDVLKIKSDEKLKNTLNKCKDHEDNVFCGWCEQCERNLCFLCISEELRKKHNYTLFMDNMPSFREEIIFNNQIKLLKSILNNYNLYCPIHKEIHYLIQLITYCNINNNLYYKVEIINNQTIINISLNIKRLDKHIHLLETTYNKNLYLFFFSNILNKNDEITNEINGYEQIIKKQLKIPEIKEKIKIIPLRKDNNYNEYTYNNINEKYFALFYLKKKDLYIYDNNLNEINKISLIGLSNDQNDEEKIEIIQYDSNVLLFFLYPKLLFIIFSPNYNKYEMILYFLRIINFGKISKIELKLQVQKNSKIIKINKKDICLLFENHIYSFNLDYIEFEEAKKINSNYQGYEIILDDTLNKKDKELILDVIPIYYTNDNNIIKEMISLGKIIIFGNYRIDGFYIYKITIYNDDLNVKDFFFIYADFDPNSFVDLNYNNLNNMLLLFVKNKIYQINLKTREITTIYDYESSSLFFDKLNIKDLYEKQLQIYSIHNYNKNLKKMEEAILLKGIKENKTYLYHWEDNSLLFKRYFLLPNCLDLAEFNIFDNNMDNSFNNKGENENPEKIFVDSNNIIIFK